MTDHLDRLAGRQQGLITRMQLRSLGLTNDQIDGLLDRGTLLRVRRGVFRVSGSPQSRLQALLAAALASGDDAVVSHLTAAEVHGFPGFPPPDRIDVLAAGSGRPRGPGIAGHRTTWLPASHRSRIGGVPLTSVERTLIDVCNAVPPSTLAQAGDELLRTRQLYLPRLRLCAQEVPVSGRRAIVPIRAFLAERGAGFHPGDSPRELDVLNVLKAAGIAPLPTPQLRVHVDNHNYRVDLGYGRIRHAYEYMGFDAHGSLVSRFHHDARRTRRLQLAGWTLWPVTSDTTEQEIVAIAHHLVSLLSAAD